MLSTDQLTAALAEIVNAPEEEMRLAILQRTLLEAARSERRRIAQELHDRLSQQLLGAAFAAKAIANALPAASPVAAEVNDLARLINSSVSQIRDMMVGGDSSLRK